MFLWFNGPSSIGIIIYFIKMSTFLKYYKLNNVGIHFNPLQYWKNNLVIYILEHHSMWLPHCLCCLSSPKYQLCFYLSPYCYLPSCCCLLSPCCLFYFPCFCGDGISPLPSMCKLLTIEATTTTFAFQKGKIFFPLSLLARLFCFSCMAFFFVCKGLFICFV